MAEGLRPHHHQYFQYDVKVWYDKKSQCIKKKYTDMCMICGKVRSYTVDCYVPPPKYKDSNKKLQKNKQKYGNRK